MAHLKRHPLEFNDQELEPSTIEYASSSQRNSVYSVQLNESQIQHPSISEVTIDEKPALPPKPFQGPPIYREPPNPPTHEVVSHHPDICINSSPTIRQQEPYRVHPERSDRPCSRTHAWVQEHKTSGKLVGEKWSSLQRKLRSFLSTSSKDLTESEKGYNKDENQETEDLTESEKGYNKDENQETEDSQSSKPLSMSNYHVNQSSVTAQCSSYISASSFNGNSIALNLPQPVSHVHSCESYHSERHPFAAPSNVFENENEEAADSDQLRDTCNKFFNREQRISWTNYLNPRNSYSNNIKSSYDYDKLVPKEVIGKPSQEKKLDMSSEDVYEGLAASSSFSRLQESVPKQPESQFGIVTDSCYNKRTQNLSEKASIQAKSCEVKVPNSENESLTRDTLPLSSTDCGDTVEVYKSSSESGRGTMHSSMHGSKNVVSPHSSGVSATSNLDTSLDSDHSANGGIWNQSHIDSDKKFTSDSQENQSRHIYETPNINCRQTAEKESRDVLSESLSENPLFPPTSIAPSPPVSAENSPKLSSRTKYKLSMSSSALLGCDKSADHLQKICDTASKTSGKKTNVRRTTSSNQVSCRHRSGKSAPFSKSTSIGNRLGISHGNYSPRKCNNSPPSRHLSRNQLAYPYYLENGDPELTSTTTGLDMESLLDEDDYSSDLSVSASTMEPSEVFMIRKQLEGLETMYSEILRLLGVKNSCKANPFATSLESSRHSRRKLEGSLSSLTGRSSNSRGNHSFADKRGVSEKRRSRESRNNSSSKRLQRLESHVVTLARSVAHLSSEMRTQHVLVQELENMRQDVTWVQERLRLMQLAQGCQSNNLGRNPPIAMPRDWDNFHKEVIELLNPCRAKKLTKFFGDEPPLIRQFLKRLGYEKYAANFESEKIGVKELPYLTEEKLQKMGIPMGPRIRILQEAITCYPQNQYKVYIV